MRVDLHTECAERSRVFIAEEIYDYESGWAARTRFGIYDSLGAALAKLTKDRAGTSGPPLIGTRVKDLDMLGVSKPGIVAAYMVHPMNDPPEDEHMHDLWIFEEQVNP